jgi:hypothetical protein
LGSEGSENKLKLEEEVIKDSIDYGKGIDEIDRMEG